ncbi:FIG01036464: hypothetical protein [hydrothermal vent metagenome]|uniref:Outer membrane beta-barrel domain-containing protein n=1 Tax=hydrothermal vent metagenome TaxID=652676 RepID=A0A3B1A4F4_9ZZZZ
MESRLRFFLLSMVLLSAGCSSTAINPSATPSASPVTPAEQVGTEPNPDKEIIQTDPVIQPDVKRREVKESDINTENFEIGAFFGVISIEDFASAPVYGLRLDYHITEDLFIQGSYGQSEAGTTSFERLSGGLQLLTDEQRQYTYYNVSIGYNLLPGEAFITKNTTFNTSFYLIAGAGSTEFAGDDLFTIVWGAGYSITANGWLAIHLDFRDYIFDIGVTGEEKTTNNLEATIGLNYYF